MPAVIGKNFGQGGSGLTFSGPTAEGGSSIREILAEILVILTDFRAKHNAAMAQLDSDAGVTGTNYATNNNFAALGLTIQ